MTEEQDLYIQVKEKLEFEPSIDESKITIGIHEGVVTLGGTVGSYAEKLAAERAINNIYGVKAVANEIEVNVAERFKHSDVDIAKAAVLALEWNVNIPSERIKITVEKGFTTLKGEVDWWYQRKLAEDTIRNLFGITGINNQILIKFPAVSKISPQTVKERITREFERNAAIDAKRVRVECHNSQIVLKGSVRSWAEREEAAQVCWSIPGVTEVDNRLTLY